MPKWRDVWENKHLILTGLINRLFSPNKQLAQERLRVCASCPFNSRNAGISVPWYKHCIKCGCTLALKPYAAESKCPMGYWTT